MSDRNWNYVDWNDHGGIMLEIEKATDRALDAESELEELRAENAALREAVRWRDPALDRPPVGTRLWVVTGRGLITVGSWNPAKEPTWMLDRDDCSPTIRGWMPLPSPPLGPGGAR